METTTTLLAVTAYLAAHFLLELPDTIMDLIAFGL